MFIIFLYIGLLSFDNDTLINEQVNETCFIYQMEEFCYSYANEEQRKQVFNMFSRFYSHEWKEREECTKVWLERLKNNPTDIRFVFWGRHSVDGEMKLRCNSLIRKINICINCSGKGFLEHSSYEIICPVCLGQKHIWGLSPWD